MKKTLVMPRLGLTMEEGTIVAWRVKEGESYAKGDVLFEVMTDKVTTEIEAEESGKLLKILVREGETVSVSAPVAEVDEG